MNSNAFVAVPLAVPTVEIKEEAKIPLTLTEPTTTTTMTTTVTITTTTTNELKTNYSDVKSEDSFDTFYSQVKEIEKRDSVLTSQQQIDRLLRPGATYFNLNPFEVLQIDPNLAFEDISKQYRKLSMLVHPDKNPEVSDRAQLAFEAVNKAYKLLEDEKERKKCLEVVDEAKERVEEMMREKRKKLKKDDKLLPIEEDTPDGYKRAIWSVTCKLFADLERLRVKEEDRKAEDRKRKAEEKTDNEEKNQIEERMGQKLRRQSRRSCNKLEII